MRTMCLWFEHDSFFYTGRVAITLIYLPAFLHYKERMYMLARICLPSLNSLDFCTFFFHIPMATLHFNNDIPAIHPFITVYEPVYVRMYVEHRKYEKIKRKQQTKILKQILFSFLIFSCIFFPSFFYFSLCQKNLIKTNELYCEYTSKRIWTFFCFCFSLIFFCCLNIF